jgi:hypothetical protein
VLEHKIKGWRREKKIALIEGRFGDLPRLSRAGSHKQVEESSQRSSVLGCVPFDRLRAHGARLRAHCGLVCPSTGSGRIVTGSGRIVTGSASTFTRAPSPTFTDKSATKWRPARV